MWGRVAALAVGFVAASALPGVLAAQAVRGTVVDRSTAPVPGVVVLLLDAANNVAARDLSDETGAFRVAAPHPGAYRLRTLRIGFRPTTSDVLQLESGQELTRRIDVADVAFSLDTVRVVGRSQCRVHSDSAAATFAMLEQVRTALTAASVTLRSRAMNATVVTYERVMDADRRRVRQQSTAVQSGLPSRAWRAREADSLRQHGYVVTGADGWQIYFAPDLDVLLSDVFLDDHCFRLAAARDTTLVGVAFEPTRDRSRIAEIQGTLWFDRKSSELRRLEFRYANLKHPQAEEVAGGELGFARLPNGSWVISRWNIRMPLLAAREVAPVPGTSGASVVYVTGVRIAGGELAFVTRGRDTLWSHPPLAVTGTATDSVSGAPLSGARVQIAGTQSPATTDVRGRFTIPAVLPGEYTIEVRTSPLDSLGLVHGGQVAVADASVDVRLRVPTAAQLIAALCGPGVGREHGVVAGTVRVPGDSTPRRGVNVVIEWADLAVKRTGSSLVERVARHVRGRTDSRGTFRLCGVPVNTAAHIRAVIDDNDDAPAMPVRIPLGEKFANVEIVVAPRAPRPD